MQQLLNTLLREAVRVLDPSSNHSPQLLTQNSAHGKLPKQNERRDRVQDRFDFTPGPGVDFVLATNRVGAPTSPSRLRLFIPTLRGCVTALLLMLKSEV